MASNDTTEWDFDTVFFYKRDFNTGEPINGQVMKRRINGKMQYRKMTDAELFESKKETAW